MIKPPRKPRASQPAKPGRKPQAPMPPLPGVKPQSPMPPLPGQKPSAPMPPMPGHKPVSYTSDITMESTLKQFYRDSLGALVDSGRANPSTLTTTPTDDSFLDGVEDPSEGIGLIFQNIANSQFAKRMENYGGPGVDSKDARVPVDGQTPPQETTYKERQRAFIAQGNENLRGRAYTSKRGRLIGYGTDIERHKDLFMETFGADEETYKEYLNGERELDQLESIRLFNRVTFESSSAITRTFKGVDLSEPQRLALESLHYDSSSLIGPNLTAFVQNGDWEAAIEEILYFSNRYGDVGVARRRLKEATMFAVGSGLEDAIPDIEEYLQTFNAPRERSSEIIPAAMTPGDPLMREPRGIRNNNPGNIEKGADWQGLAGEQTDSRFATFESPEFGIRAMAVILRNYKLKHGLTTVKGIINRWAPPFENVTSSYVKHVAKAVGVDPDDQVDVEDPQIMIPLVQAMIKHENGKQPYGADVIRKGVGLAGIGAPAEQDAPESAPELPEVIHAERGDNYPKPLWG